MFKLIIRLISILGITQKNRKAIRKFLFKYIYIYIRNPSCSKKEFMQRIEYSCHISPKIDILKLVKEKNLRIPHPIGLVLWDTTKLGKNIMILQNTSVDLGAIEIQDNVQIKCNCCISKNVTIGEGSIIGANSFVNKDVPPYELWGGVPAKFIRKVTKEEVEAYKKVVNAID